MSTIYAETPETWVITVECPLLEQHESGVGFAPCGGEVEVKLTGEATWTTPTHCPSCDREYSDFVRAELVIAADAAMDAWDPSPYCTYGHMTSKDCDCGPIVEGN